MAAQLVVIVVVIAFDGCVLDRAVHSFDLAVGPGMIDLGESVFDTVLAATQSEHVRHIWRVRPICVSRRQPELDAIIGEHRMDFVGNGFDQGDQEGRCGNAIGLFGQRIRPRESQPVADAVPFLFTADIKAAPHPTTKPMPTSTMAQATYALSPKGWLPKPSHEYNI